MKQNKLALVLLIMLIFIWTVIFSSCGTHKDADQYYKKNIDSLVILDHSKIPDSLTNNVRDTPVWE